MPALSGVGNSAHAPIAVVAGRLYNLAIGDSAVTVGGGFSNQARGTDATISGGHANVTWESYATVSGGLENFVSGMSGTVGGGFDNFVYGTDATVAGGHNNGAYEWCGTVAGGFNNGARAIDATVGGGGGNVADGSAATVAGGEGNAASGHTSFAAGRYAKTESETGDSHDGAVLFADATETEFRSKDDNELRSQMPVFAPSFNRTSARAEKRDVTPVDPEAALDAVTDVEVSTWEFEGVDDGRHMGPMAGEFNEAFDLGADRETVAAVDADGASLAAVQGLAHRVEEKDERIETLEADVAALREENERLRERYSEVEARVAALEDG